MRARILIALTLIVLIGVFLVACQKPAMGKAFSNAFDQTFKKVFGKKLHAAEPHPIQAPVQVSSGKKNSGPLNRKNLGVLPLSNHISTTISLGRNTQCVLTPTLLESGDVQIILAMETTGADGKPLGMNVARVLARPNEPFDVSIGNLDLAFTPQMADP